MKKLFNWVAGFFSADSPNSSKRLVGIVGAGFLYWTLYSNSHSESHVVPAESLVWGTVVLVCTSLGLASVKEIGDLIGNFKGNKTSE
jgi:hypothetical protein|tara:strand:- start:3800 stop:4060 length:261 start_codon:yes stop_codon:yes gene_type:complete